MKKKIIIGVFLCFSLFSFSQHNRDKIKALKIAFITEKLELTEQEAKQFWPIYNAFEDENHKLREQSFASRKGIDFKTLKEEDALSLLKEMRSFEAKRIVLKNHFVDDLMKVLPAKKIILLEKVEEDFKHRLFEEFKNRRLERRP